MKNKNTEELTYIKVYDWYNEKLELTMGELLVFALIDGYTQNKGFYEGSISGISKRLGIARKNLTSIIKRLTDKHYIEKIDKPMKYNGGTYYPYRSIVNPYNVGCHSNNEPIDVGCHSTLIPTVTTPDTYGNNPLYVGYHDSKEDIKANIKDDMKEYSDSITSSFSSLIYPKMKNSDISVYRECIEKIMNEKSIDEESAITSLETAISKYIEDCKAKGMYPVRCYSLQNLLTIHYDWIENRLVIVKADQEEHTENNDIDTNGMNSLPYKDYFPYSYTNDEEREEQERKLSNMYQLLDDDELSDVDRLTEMKLLYKEFERLPQHKDHFGYSDRICYDSEFIKLCEDYPRIDIKKEFEAYKKALEDTNNVNYMDFGYFITDGWLTYKEDLFPRDWQ